MRTGIGVAAGIPGEMHELREPIGAGAQWDSSEPIGVADGGSQAFSGCRG